jgi:hypothetical protein
VLRTRTRKLGRPSWADTADRSTFSLMRSVIAVLHNPHKHVCACDPDCFCNTTSIGRAIKWRVSARFLARVGIHHKNRHLDEWKRIYGEDALRERKRNRSAGMSSMVRQPRYQRTCGLGSGAGASRYAATTAA